MYLFDFFRSLLPLRNPIGFGAADFVALAVALLLGVLLVAQAALLPFVKKLAERPGYAMGVLAALPVGLRLALLKASPIPMPAGADDFGYVLLADTLQHLRFANPPQALSQFFEAQFILQHPTYSSIYPPGQGMLLAIGHFVSGSYWVGVLLSAAALPALCYWMLRAWIRPGWALVGGLLAAITFGPLSPWMNSYWGGYVSACAGCLVFGALPRLAEKRSMGWLLGLGLAFELLTRPFEFTLLFMSVVLYAVLFVPRMRWRWMAYAAPLPLLALLLIGVQNKSVTGSWTTLPYQLSRYQYGIPTTFTFQANPTPHGALTPEQDFDYRAQAAIHGSIDTLGRYVARLVERVAWGRFFLLAPLGFAVWFVAMQRPDRKVLYAVAVIALFFLGTNFYPFFFAHYIAAVTCLFLFVGVAALSRMRLWNPLAAALVVCLCAAHFVFWYAIHLSNHSLLLEATPFESFDFVNHGDPEGRIAVARVLARQPGEQLVFVRYAPEHRFGEWIANEAEIDRARVVWALDLGEEENRKLEQYYPQRKRWLLEPDIHPPRMTPIE